MLKVSGDFAADFVDAADYVHRRLESGGGRSLADLCYRRVKGIEQDALARPADVRK